jgi:indolepyruvate decarboxylase
VATVADYILKRLTEHKVDTLFGVPAAYCSELFDAAPAHNVRSVVTASDLEAGYAADGYARMKGLGAVSVAYGVGALSMINAIAGACVERSPVVIVNGGPNSYYLNNLKNLDVVFSHSIGQPDTDLSAYKLVTTYAARANTVAEVPGVVDTAIATAIRRKRPVYIEINMDIWNLACPAPAGPLNVENPPFGTEKALAAQTVQALRAAANPVILVGAEVQRYGLADKATELIAALGVRYATALLAKSAVGMGTGWLGTYNPPHASATVRTAVETADVLLMLGCVFPNGYANLLGSRLGHIIWAHDGKVRVRGGNRQNAEIGALVTEMVAEAKKAPPRAAPPGVMPATPGSASGPLTYRQVFERIGVALDDSWLVIPDTFLGVFPSANLPTQGRDAFLCSAVWASIGHSVAAALGASFASSRRPLVLCGDGGFHMTAQALATIAHYKRNPVIVVVDNGIYAYEQYLINAGYFASPNAQPRPYVVLPRWDFVAFATGLGFTFAKSVNTAASFDAALADAKAFNGPALIAAKVDPHGKPAGV